jgi:hypothetical protein
MTFPSERKWYENLAEVHAFAAALVAAGEMDVKDLLAMLDRPWRWTPEYERWVAKGRPELYDEAAA